MPDARSQGQQRRRDRELATGRPPTRPRLAEHALRVWCEEWALHPWSNYLTDGWALVTLLEQAARAGFRSTRRQSLEARLRRVLEQGEDA